MVVAAPVSADIVKGPPFSVAEPCMSVPSESLPNETAELMILQVAVALYRYDGHTTPWHQASEELNRRYIGYARVSILTYEKAVARLVAESRGER